MDNISTNDAKIALDNLINKSRVHLYKPIQIAEILYFDRCKNKLDILDLESYRSKSKNWRDIISKKLVGRISTSSARFQDNLFDTNAIPPKILKTLSDINRETNGSVELYIYTKFIERNDQLSNAISLCEKDPNEFNLKNFLASFYEQKGLKRSLDKIYEIIVFSLFQSIIHAMNIKVTVSIDEKNLDILKEFSDFSKKVLNLDIHNHTFTLSGSINRVGITNAADRGLDMWGNFGIVIQIKHLSLNETLAEEIVTNISSDRIIIVCKSIEQKIIISLLNQIGWKSKIQSIITEEELIDWYNIAFHGQFNEQIGKQLLYYLKTEILKEFPSSTKDIIFKLFNNRDYNLIKTDDFWNPINVFIKK